MSYVLLPRFYLPGLQHDRIGSEKFRSRFRAAGRKSLMKTLDGGCNCSGVRTRKLSPGNLSESRQQE